MEVYDIKEFVQFIPGACFKPFADKVVQLRVEATYENDDAKQLTAKLFGNSGNIYIGVIIMNDFSAYGKNSEDVTRHLNRSLVTDEEILAEKVQGRYFKEVKQVLNEENVVAGHILSERKSKIDDDKPVHIGFSILAWSKLLFLRFLFCYIRYFENNYRFMTFLYQHLEEGSFKTAYADTDRESFQFF